MVLKVYGWIDWVWTHIYVCKFCYFGKAAQVEFADIAFQFSNSILLGAPATQMATVQRCSCNVRPSGSEILTHQRMSTVIHWWSKPSSICSSRRVQEYFRNVWLRKKCETTEFREQDLWEVSRENRAAERGFKSGEIRRELCERVSGTRTDWVSAHSHRWDQVWQKCWLTSVLRKITQSVNDNRTYCFSTKQGPYGWCATCKVEFFLGILLKIVFVFFQLFERYIKQA